MDLNHKVKSIADSVAVLLKETEHNFYTAFDHVFATSDLDISYRDEVQREVGRILGERAAMSRRNKMRQRSTVEPVSPRRERAYQQELISIFVGYPD